MSESDTSETSPAERRRLRVRASILDAAERVYAEQGEEGLSIRRLAEEIDYSPAAIYKYFGSKDELVSELKEAFFERILVRVEELRASGAPFEERARECFKGYICTALERPQHYLGAFAGQHSGDEPMAAESNKARAFEFLIEMVEEGQALGHFRAGPDPVALAKSVWACVHGAASLMAHLPDFPGSAPRPVDMDRDAFLDLHADTVLNGLLKR